MSDPTNSAPATGLQEEWVRAPLSRFLTPNVEVVDVDPNQTYPTVGVLNRGRGLLYRDPVAGSATAYKKLNRISPGVLVYSRLKAFEGAITVTPDGLPESFASQEFPTFTFAPDADPDFFRILTTTQSMWHALQGASKGMGGRRERVKPADFLNIVMDIPPLPAQERIVEIVGAVDDHIAALDAEVASLRSLLAGTRRELESVEDKTTLVDLAEPRGIQIGPFGSQLHAHEYTEDPSGAPVVMPQDLVDGQILTTKIKRVPHDVAARLSRHRLAEGDIVFPRRGDLSKRALVVAEQDGWLCGTGCIRFRPQDSSLSRLLAEALSGAATTEWLVSHAVGTTMLNLNTEILSNLPVADIKGHHEIAEASLEVAEVIRRTQLQATRLRKVRAGLLSRLLDRTIDIESAKVGV